MRASDLSKTFAVCSEESLFLDGIGFKVKPPVWRENTWLDQKNSAVFLFFFLKENLLD